MRPPLGLLFLLVSVAVLPAAAQTAGTSPVPPCDHEPVYRAFDFWIGTWDVFLASGPQAGTNRITRSENGCLLLEQWASVQGGTGSSMNYVDPTDGRWRQVWVDGGGHVLYLAGGLANGAMRLSGELIDAAGKRSRLRGTWTPLEDGRVRQFFEQSLDEGVTWAPWFDGYYQKRATP
jgi:hypothetical protein